VEAVLADLDDTPTLPAIISRAEAKAAGSKRYFTGDICSKGHLAERLTSNGNCVVCGKNRYDAWRTANPEKAKASYTNYRAANPDKNKMRCAAYYAANCETLKQNAVKRRLADPDKAREVWAKYRQANLEKRRADNRANNRARYADPEWRRMDAERLRAWALAYPEKRNTIRRTRRAREMKAEGRHTADDILAIYKAQKGKCACCSVNVGECYHVDHIQPLARGGSNFKQNLQILCPTCNQQKNARDPIEFMQSRGFLL
jgi:5-methylcytosine-specific restriction endonuclease McrA